MSVYKAINAVQRALAKTGISKDRTNTQGATYKFRGIDDVYNAISPLMAEHGLCILPRMLERVCEERQSQKGNALFYVTVKAEFDFVSTEDGSKHTVATYGEAMDSGDKATNKAMSAAYKYAAFQAFAIPTEGDNDADGSTHEVAGRWGLSRERADIIEKAAHAAITKFKAGNEYGAYEEVCWIDDNEEKLALWWILKEHSALRASIKKQIAAERAAEPKVPA